MDWMRVVACFMVMVVHSTEPFYLGGPGTQVASASDALWVTIVDSLVRACVPLFIIASSYLQFPLHYPAGKFLRRRALRVVVPLLVWSVVYALIWGEPVQNFKDLLLNFNYAAGHLWFVYMIVGLYLVMPLLSPWASRVSRRQLRFYLGIWLFTTTLPFLRIAFGGEPPVIYGPSGIPNPARYPLWGEASWNANGTFYYLSGLAGYLLVGLYFRRFAPVWSTRKSVFIGLLLWACGFVISAGGFQYLMHRSTLGVYPFSGPTGFAAIWETPWLFDSTGVALMSIGLIILFRLTGASGRTSSLSPAPSPSAGVSGDFASPAASISPGVSGDLWRGWFYRRIVLPISGASYGMYLCHMVFLGSWYSIYSNLLGPLQAVVRTPLVILCTALSTYLTSAALSLLLSRLPKFGKYLT